MFYAQLILAKKSSLSRLWLAVHWEKKLTKAQIYETNIDEACQHILKPYDDNPKTSLALRISAHLLLGVCRIAYKKTSYLLTDCNEVCSKIKDAADRFRSSAELILNDSLETHQINLKDAPQVLVDLDFDSALPDFDDMTLEMNLKNNQSRLDDITLKDDLSANFTKNIINLQDFGHDDFGEQGLHLDSQFDYNNLMMGGDSGLEQIRDESLLRGLSNRMSPFDDQPLENQLAPGCDSDAGDNLNLMPLNDEPMEVDNFHMEDSGLMFGEPKTSNAADEGANIPPAADSLLGGNQTAVSEDPDSFQLDSLDSDAILENQKGQKRRKKHLFIIDNYTEISNEELRANIDDYTDIIRPTDMAPPTRILMKFKETGSAQRLLAAPATSIGSRTIIKYYKSNCVLRVGDDRKSIDEANAKLREELELAEIEESRHHDAMQFADESGRLPLGEIDVNASIGLEGPSKPDNSVFFHDDIENMAPLDQFDPSVMERCATPPEFHRLDLPESPLRLPEELSTTPAKKRKLDETSDSDISANGDAAFKIVKKTRALHNTIVLKLDLSDEVKFSDLLKKDSNRKLAAQRFYTILTLKKMEAIDVRQDAPYEEIYITKGSKIDQVFA